MTHGRKPRQPRTRVQSPLRLAAWQAALLSAHQVNTIMQPLRDAFRAMREGVATELQWAYLVSAMNIADSISLTSPVRGTRGHIVPAQHALNGYMRRAIQPRGEWLATDLYIEESELIRDALDVYHHLLQHITRGDFQRAEAHALADVCSTAGAAGAAVITHTPAGVQLAIAGV